MGHPSPIPIRSSTVLLAACLALPGAVAGPRTAPFELPAGESTRWHVDFEVPHAGTVTVVADWSADRPLSFQVDGPEGSAIVIRRAGPPPQRIEWTVDSEIAARGGTWSVRIHALPSREPASGTITVALPETAAVEPASAPEHVDDRPADPGTPWREPRPLPEDVTDAEREWLLALERFRNSVVAGAHPDRYDWQDGMLRWMATLRDERGTSPQRPDDATRRVLAEIAGAIRAVDALRTSDDPLVAGPAPSDPARRRTWLALRSERLGPVERSLDDLLTKLRRGHAPELEREAWSMRLVSALSACERPFDEVVSLGVPRSADGRIAEEQWMRLLSAAEVLEELPTSVDRAE
jgi:hypothetical protein